MNISQPHESKTLKGSTYLQNRRHVAPMANTFHNLEFIKREKFINNITCLIHSSCFLFRHASATPRPLGPLGSLGPLGPPRTPRKTCIINGFQYPNEFTLITPSVCSQPACQVFSQHKQHNNQNQHNKRTVHRIKPKRNALHRIAFGEKRVMQQKTGEKIINAVNPHFSQS